MEKVQEETLAALYAKNSVTLSDGREVAVSKMKVKHIKTSLDLIRNILEGLSTATKGSEQGTSGIPGLSGGLTPDTILQLISNNIDATFKLLSYHVSIPEADIQELDIEDLFALVMKAVELNKDFFTQKVLPALRLTPIAEEPVEVGLVVPPTTEEKRNEQ